MKYDELAFLNQQLATMLREGIPLEGSLRQLCATMEKGRLQRDFSSMLGLLLDAGVPEEKVLNLAAASTANRVFMQRAVKAQESLRHGTKLTKAVQMLDDTGELGWRLANGAHGPRGFFSSLEGWHASLDAKAFQLEQAGAHVISTILVVLNACTVVLVAVGVFQFLACLSNAPMIPIFPPHK